jgi:two-component system nitrate/nitrite response regulator NarL
MRLVLVDDHPIVLAGLDRLFASTPDVEVVARCQTGREALEMTRTLRPDLVLLDLKLPDMSGLDVLGTIRQEGLPVRVVLLSAAAMADDVEAARRLAADGLLYKELSPDQLVAEVARAAAGLRPFPPEVPEDPAVRAVRTALSARELQVVRAVAAGLRNRAIAEQLGIAEGTVKLHLHNIYEKLNIDSRLELMLLATRAGIGATDPSAAAATVRS